MRDHGLFQAICRVNRLDGEDKVYGYVIDYKDLFHSLEGAVREYTSGALDGFDKEDVAGLLENRLEKAREDLEKAREAIKALCEPIEPPKDTVAYLRYFCARDSGNADQLKDNEPKRLKLYQYTAALQRAFAALANELGDAGYIVTEIEDIKSDVNHFTKARDEVRLASGDYVDLKMFEPAMRHLIDTYIRAEESVKISAFDDLSLVQLILERGAGAVEALPERIRKNQEAVAEAIENNVRRLIVDESPVDPAYYEKMSALLDALIEQRRQDAIEYQTYLAEISELTKKIVNSGGQSGDYPPSLNTAAKRALYNNLGQDETLALSVDKAVQDSRQDGWRTNPVKVKRVKLAIKAIMKDDENLADHILDLVKNQNEY